MKRTIYSFIFSVAMFVTISGCSEKEYTMGELTAPSDVAIVTEVVGVDATHPNGNGTGDVKITVMGKNIIATKVDFDASNAIDWVQLPNGTITKKYTNVGLNTYKITAVVYGKGGTSTTVTKDVTVRSDFSPAAEIVTNLTGGSSKTWVVDKDADAHFGVGPWTGNKSDIPDWWRATPNEKAGCCNCFYTATFTFKKETTPNVYTLQVASPDGVFSKAGNLTTLPGLPSAGGEACYSYSGGSSSFSFVPAASAAVPASGSTKTSILLAGNNTYIGYGSLLKEYEILSITPTSMYLRVQGTETGNAWYLKLIPR